MTAHIMPLSDQTHPHRGAVPADIRPCEFELCAFSKHDDVRVEASGPTLGIAISHALPELRHLSHPRAVFGARPFSKGRTYGAWEIIFPDEEERPGEGYEQFDIRRAVGFGDSIEVFDVYQELEEYRGLLRYRAQDLGDGEKSIAIIFEGVTGFVQAARHAMLWDPECKLNIPYELNELFLDRDWTSYISNDAFIVPPFAIEEVRVIAQTDETEYLIGFRYRNGDTSGVEMEYVDIKKGRPTVRRDAFSALRSPVPVFRGDQLTAVYDKLQSEVESHIFDASAKR